MAKTIAAQDVPAEQLDARIQQWMAVATPTRPSDQVAMLTGVHPAADPGQPQALALNNSPAGTRLAQLLPKTAPSPVQPQPQPHPAAAIPAAPPPALPEPEPAVVAEATRSLMTPPQAPQEQPDVIQPEAPVVQAVASKPVPQAPTRFDTPIEPAKYVAITDTVRRAAKEVRKANGRSSSVVQLGAYSSADRVNVAWANLTKRYPALANYTPMRARFSGAKGTFWRLSIKGFDSQQEAAARCEQLQSRGGNCFVRRVAGDAPVQFASR
jgi:hypothetical protein